MKKQVFEYRDYKLYLADFIQSKPGRGHGIQAHIARALNCHTAYVSQVLNRGAHFSLEQGEALNGFLNHSREESNYFLLLIQMARAGTVSLKKRIQEQMDEISERRLQLRNRVDVKKNLDLLDQQTYYSHWYYAAIHILITIPGYQDKIEISKYLGISTELITEVLEFLTRAGLIYFENGIYKAGVNRIFLGSDSPLITKHHSNWRLKAIQSMDTHLKQNLHYSTVYSLSKSDIPKVKERLIKVIEEIRQNVKDSPEEELQALNIDFFSPKF